jgi:hypothetical protein
MTESREFWDLPVVGMSQSEIFLYEELGPERQVSTARFSLAIEGQKIEQTLTYRPLPGSGPRAEDCKWIFISSLGLDCLRCASQIELVDSQTGRRILLNTQRLLADHKDCFGR